MERTTSWISVSLTLRVTVFGGSGAAAGGAAGAAAGASSAQETDRPAKIRIAPAVARPFYVAWHAAAACVGLIVGNLLLLMLYYGVLTGLGVLRRRFGRPALRKAPVRGAHTYWGDVDHRTEPRHYYRQF